MINSCSRSNCSFLNKFFYQIVCFLACSTARSSASVVKVMTIDCLQDIQLISPPYNLKIYSSPNCLLGLFTKEASTELSKMFIEKLIVVVSYKLLYAEYLIAKYLIL